MPEPISPTATATAVALGATLPVLQTAAAVAPQLVLFGVSVGLRVDVLVAGFAGAVVAIAFFNAVPSTGDTWRELIRTTLRRTWYTLASSVTAGYLTPLLMLMDGILAVRIPEALMLSVAFVAGVGAQKLLSRVVSRSALVAGGGKPGGGAGDAA